MVVEVEDMELDLGLSIGRTFKNQEQESKSDENPEHVPDSRTKGFHFHSDHNEDEIREKKRDWVRESDQEQQGEPKREKTEHNGLWKTAPFHVQFVPLSNDGFELPCLSYLEVPSFLATSEQNGGQTESGSSMFRSSVVSNYQSSSPEDGDSTDSHSHSAHSLAEPTPSSSKEHCIAKQTEQNASSNLMRSELCSNAEWRNHSVKESQPYTPQPAATKPTREATTNSKSVPTPCTKPLSNENSNNGPLKDTKVDTGKPPKPVTRTSSLPQMPYVSTTGNGPNGKTVHGFLHKYSKSEVSIVCVCHGSSFSPAEFVQHAGGTDISHPLRHITVIPSAFG
ncbi:hypothetical protein RIF29_00664 [Crotalaria pallida]|uniref:Ninja-family protein n=1 Tax=Crotalaria pallida TaxID=3830 RepID=A0AAN9P7B8_CROPI